MTRINVVPPECLTDKHLLAEYRELPRIFTATRTLTSQGVTADEYLAKNFIPKNYVLGTNHVKFFYNKISFLYKRYKDIVHELENRNFKLDYEMISSILLHCQEIDASYYGEYKPTPEDMYLNMARLAKRSNILRVLTELKEG